MDCPSCLRALQVADHRDFQPRCVGCGIRKLALMSPLDRERQMDLITHLCGPDARKRVREDLRVEVARIKKLRGARAKERT